MKLYFSLIIICFVLLLSCSSNKIKIESDLSKLRLKGSVKRIEKTTYNAIERFGEIQKNGLANNYRNPNTSEFYRVLNFNKYGYIVKQEYFYNGSPAGHTEIEYDENNRAIKDIWYNVVGKIEYSSDKKYDDTKRLCESEIFRNFGQSGNIEREHKIEFYDDKNNVVKADGFKNKVQIYRQTFQYDSKSLLTREALYDQKGELSSTILYKYDERNNLIAKRDSLQFGKFSDELVHYKYNADNNIIEEAMPNETFQINFLYEYKYDSNGNWILRTEYNGNQNFKSLRYQTERIIEYY